MTPALKKLIPSPLEVGREAIIVMAGVTLAAFIISRYPEWQRRIQAASITVKDGSGRVVF